MRRLAVTCVLCLTVGWASNPAWAETRVGVITSKTADAQNLAALLEVRLTQRPGTALVERSEIDKVLGEQELQALLVADAPGKRAALGKMLKADLLIFLTDSQEPKPHVMMVVCETARGLRLCAEPVFLTNQAEADVAAMFAKVEDAAEEAAGEDHRHRGRAAVAEQQPDAGGRQPARRSGLLCRADALAPAGAVGGRAG